ncbi:3D domain-containing protein [Desulfotruncus alcoholivorax]|uniref:3D domain-containing protein n=1 Tax=Desulfotruncus alcoholivorax TaxID=265477 RepID=UPI0003FEFD87|nr:3D domain-containing protein [Desulfotruncus alcoholivorax]
MSINQKMVSNASAANFAVRRVAAVAAVFILSTVILLTYNASKKSINLVVDGKQITVKTFASDVNSLLNENDVRLGEKDRVYPGLTEKLEDNMTVTVRKAVPVTLQVADNKLKVITAAATVDEVLEENAITLSKLDIVNPAVDQPVKKGMDIQVDKITTGIIEEKVPIPNKIKREQDNNLVRGVVKVVREGSQGLAVKKWEIIFKNGRETEKRLLASNIVQQPVDRVIRLGTLQTVSRGGHQIRFSKALNMVATAYTHTGRNTHTGIAPRVGVAAVDPSVIPLGSKMYVEGYGYCQAADIGSRIKGNRIDVFMDSRSQALSWGRRNVKVYLLN